ncbi:MAG: cytochrome c [Rhodospirillaceae bacterium]
MKRVLLLLALTACDDMARQDRVDAYDGPAAPPIPGTVARGTLAEFSPPEVTPDLVARGEARFAIYCVPCHGPQGRGDGPVAGRTMPFPPPFTKVDASVERIVEVITQGSGPMPPYGDRIPLADRWAIAAHVDRLRGVP